MSQVEDASRAGGAYRAWSEAGRSIAEVNAAIDDAVSGVAQLSNIQVELLAELARHVDTPPTVRDVARSLHVTPFAVARVVSDLDTRGLVAIGVVDGGSPDLVVTITDAGVAAARGAVSAVDALLAGPTTREVLTRVVSHVQAVLGAGEDDRAGPS